MIAIVSLIASAHNLTTAETWLGKKKISNVSDNNWKTWKNLWPRKIEKKLWPKKIEKKMTEKNLILNILTLIHHVTEICTYRVSCSRYYHRFLYRNRMNGWLWCLLALDRRTMACLLTYGYANQIFPNYLNYLHWFTENSMTCNTFRQIVYWIGLFLSSRSCFNEQSTEKFDGTTSNSHPWL